MRNKNKKKLGKIIDNEFYSRAGSTAAFLDDKLEQSEKFSFKRRPNSVRPTVPTVKAEITGSGFKNDTPVFDLTVTRDGKPVHNKTIQKSLGDFMKLDAALDSKYESL